VFIATGTAVSSGLSILAFRVGGRLINIQNLCFLILTTGLIPNTQTYYEIHSIPFLPAQMVPIGGKVIHSNHSTTADFSDSHSHSKSLFNYKYTQLQLNKQINISSLKFQLPHTVILITIVPISWQNSAYVYVTIYFLDLRFPQ
jgi:hypothetical protein